MFWFKFVVATDEDKLPIDELNPDVVVATDEDKLPIDEDTEELNVEYPVVDVNVTCTLPDMTPSVLSLFLIVVSIDEVNKFNELVLVSMLDNLLLADDVNELNEPVIPSILVSLLLTEELKSVKLIPSIVPVISIEPETTISLANTTGVPPTEDCIFCFWLKGEGPTVRILGCPRSGHIS